MTIQFIACACKYDDNSCTKLGIGNNDKLLVYIKEDILKFKNITMKNVVVMGRKTWDSIDERNRPLKDRINIVLTRDPILRKKGKFPLQGHFPFNNNRDFNKIFNKTTYFWTFEEFKKFYKLTNDYCMKNVYVIGGSEIFNLFMEKEKWRPKSVHLTEVTKVPLPENLINFKEFEPLSSRYTINEVSELYHNKKPDANYRFIKYIDSEKDFSKHSEHKYLELCKDILANGNERIDRTGVGTFSVFCRQIEFDISENVPLLTTKKIPWKHVIHELLWFCRGDTDVYKLQKDGVKIWNGNTSRSFLDSRGLTNYKTGILGPGYGWQWRFFGAKYDQSLADVSQTDASKIGGFDQLKYVINEIKTNPYSRRILMCYWNPPDFDKTALLPCHYSCQFYVENDRLNCHFTMRSTDVFLGLPFNIFSYTVLTYIIAMKCDLKPGKVVYTGGDVHLYKTHIKQVQEMLKRNTRALPTLIVNENVKMKDFEDITINDFDIAGYYPHSTIKAKMAV